MPNAQTPCYPAALITNEERAVLNQGIQGVRVLAVAVAALLSVGAAQAGPEADSRGWYLGANLGTAKGKSKVYDGKSEPSFGFAAGYRFNPNLSAELFSRSLNFEFLVGFLDPKGYVYPEDHVGAALRLSAPLNESFQLYGRLGVGRTTMKATLVNMRHDSVSETSLGAGLGYDFNPSWGLQLEYNRFLKNDINVLSLGLQFRF
jgi:OOP family OmpA-OmpF porin